MARGRRPCYHQGRPATESAPNPVPHPNAIAYLMLALWPGVAYLLWRRTDPQRALIWTLLAGYLLLPPIAAFNLPAVPDFDKTSIPSLAALALAVLVARARISFLPASMTGRILIACFVLSPLATVLTNTDPIPNAVYTVQGMRIYDSIAAMATQAIQVLPFFLARHFLASPAALRRLNIALILAGLVYAGPMLLETVTSPQMNIWVYGFFQHEFAQSIRGGGYRPFMFLQHGLWVAFFALMCLMAMAAILREGPAERRPGLLLGLVFFALLLAACKSFGPIAYGLAFVPLILAAPRRAQILLAAALAGLVVVYPLLRGGHLIPLESLVAFADSISGARAESLAYRIQNEERLLAHAALRPLFGWGGYARNLIADPVTGQVLTVPDGAWVIVLGIYGWLGYLAAFGLLALPLLLLGREALVPEGGRSGAGQELSGRFSSHVAATALMLAANLMDLLPNATLTPLTWLMAGALLGHAEALRQARHDAGRGLHAGAAAARPPRRTVI